MEMQGKAASGVISISRHPEIVDSRCLSDERGIAPHHQRPPSRSSGGTSLSHQAITDELERILSSPEFKRKPSLRGFLHFVVERTLSGRTHEIKGYTVATQVFGRGDDFDNNLDPIVRIQAGRMRRAIERYYINGGRNNPVRIEIPKGSYVPTFQKVLPEEQGSNPSDQPVKFILPRVRGSFSLSIMPIANLTSDPDQDHLAEGLSQELAIELSHWPDLKVFHSVPLWSGKRTKGGAVGEEMGARFALTGSIRRDEDFLKIALQLVDTSTRLQVWGDQYRYELGGTGVIGFQEDVARRVAGRVGGPFGLISEILTRESRHKPVEALQPREAFLRFYRHLLFPSGESFLKALEAIEHVLAHDGECGPAWSMLGVLHGLNHTLGCVKGDKSFEKAMGYARKGAGLSPRNHYVRVMLSFLYFLTGERDLSLRESEWALSMNPDAPEIMAFSGLLTSLCGKWDEGCSLLEKGMGLSPNYPRWFHLATSLLAYREGRFGKAYEEAQRMQSPQLYWDPLLRSAALAQLGRAREAREALGELLSLRPDFSSKHRQLIGYYVKDSGLVDQILDGLSRGGLNFSPKSSVPVTFSYVRERELSCSLAPSSP